MFPREIFRRDEEDRRRRPSPGLRGTRRSPASFSHRRAGLTKYPAEKIRGTAGVVRELCGLSGAMRRELLAARVLGPGSRVSHRPDVLVVLDHAGPHHVLLARSSLTATWTPIGPFSPAEPFGPDFLLEKWTIATGQLRDRPGRVPSGGSAGVNGLTFKLLRADQVEAPGTALSPGSCTICGRHDSVPQRPRRTRGRRYRRRSSSPRPRSRSTARGTSSSRRWRTGRSPRGMTASRPGPTSCAT